MRLTAPTTLWWPGVVIVGIASGRCCARSFATATSPGLNPLNLFQKILCPGYPGCLLRQPSAFGYQYDHEYAELSTAQCGLSSPAPQPWWSLSLVTGPFF